MARKLTPKQEAFRIAYLESGNGRQAYRLAYDADGMSDASVDKEVKRLLKNNPLLDPLSDKIQIQAEAKALLSYEEHMENLRRISEKAEADGKYAAAYGAEVKRGELRKFYVKQVEVGEVGDFSRMSDDELDGWIKTEAVDQGIAKTRH